MFRFSYQITVSVPVPENFHKSRDLLKPKVEYVCGR